MEHKQKIKVALATTIITASIAIQRDERKYKRKWTRDWLKHQYKSSYNQIFQELRFGNRMDFINYMRMPPEIFFMILNKVDPIIRKKNTNMRQSIPSGARLEATLR